jgi:hypothetical protein
VGGPPNRFGLNGALGAMSGGLNMFSSNAMGFLRSGFS